MSSESTTEIAPANAAAVVAVSTMQAVVQNGYGDAKDVLSFANPHPAPPAPSAHQVQIRVHAASINPIDVKQLHGTPTTTHALAVPAAHRTCERLIDCVCCLVFLWG